jgi:UDP-2,3-diacylglucosamine pyrophosphatase LpxH
MSRHGVVLRSSTRGQSEQLRADPSLGWVACGHSHLPVVREVEPGRYYLNAGDWITHFTYIAVQDGVPALHTWARP